MIYKTPNIDKKMIPCDWNEGNRVLTNFLPDVNVDRYIRSSDYEELLYRAKIILNINNKLDIKLLGGSDVCLLTILQYLSLKGYSLRIPLNEYAQIEHFASVFTNFEKVSHNDLFKNISPFEVIYFSNPGNPSCFYLNEEEILSVVCNNRESIFIIDLAYIEFESNFDFSYFIDCENVIFLRTFSKFFGAAGVRLGAFIFSDNSKLGNFFNMLNSKLIGSIHFEFINNLFKTYFDQGIYASTVRSRLKEIVECLTSKFNFRNYAIAGNFVRIDLNSQDEKDELLNFFNEKKIQVRELSHFKEFEFSLRFSYRDEAYKAICF